MRNNMRNIITGKSLRLLIYIFPILIILNSCFKDRFPVGPKEYETRRPEINYSIPSNDEHAVDTLDKGQPIVVWFDELMDTTTLSQALTVQLIADDYPWESINSIAYLDQNVDNPDELYLARMEKGAFHTMDRGVSWNFVPGLAGYEVSIIKANPGNSAELFAAVDSGLVRSGDGGETTELVLDGEVITCINFSPENPDIIWVGTKNGVYKTTSGGDSWDLVGDGSNMNYWDGHRITTIKESRSNPQTVFAATLGRYIYKSTDGGNSWTLMQEMQNRYIYDLALDPNDSNILYAASKSDGILKSYDGGESWTIKDNGMSDLRTRGLYLTAEYPKLVYARTDDFMYVSKDSAHSWQSIQNPTDTSIVNQLVVSPQDTSEIVAVTNTNIFFSTNSGNNWQLKERINPESITARGNISLTKWNDTLQFVNSDTIALEKGPYRNEIVLSGYDAGARDEPPIDPDPEATELNFQVQENVFENWKYKLVIHGIFNKNGIWRGETYPAAQDIHGNSLKSNYKVNFIIKE